MRIQHNIMAMNAYRNYTNNVSAMKKNLEKLSSGYKINRAGDDAAGLAISEKMRAQITGLQTAQKNAKDGISLVQTAEGALTEVHDMLNRMVELATQSANGTYDNTVDRYQLQKEVDQLLDEINRIADSSNFNGIKLLDGTLGLNSEAFTVEKLAVEGTADAPGEDLTADVVTAGKATDGDTHISATGDEIPPTFSIDFADLQMVSKGSNVSSFKVTVGGATIGAAGTFAAAGTTNAVATRTAKNLADAFVAKFNNKKDAAGSANKAGYINGLLFTAAADDNGKVTFTYQGVANGGAASATGVASDKALGDATAANSSKTYADRFNAFFGGEVAIAAETNFDGTQKTGRINCDILDTVEAVGAGEKQRAGISFTLGSGVIADGNVITIDGKDFTIKTAGSESVVAEDAENVIDLSKLVAASATTTALLREVVIQLANPDNDETDNFTIHSKDPDSGIIHLEQKVSSFEGDDSDAENVVDPKTYGYDELSKLVKVTGPETKGATPGTKLIVDDTKIKEGNVISVGTDKFVQGVDFKNAAELKTAIEKKGYTVESAAGTGDYADKTVLTIRAKATTDGTDPVAPLVLGKGLTLQIGDTSDSYNQLNVAVRDMHVDSLGLHDLKINTEETAQAAIAKIKAAINTVSDVRGTLGATQNRLDHTINNLSVMTENIQDAESTIRDTDVADEMMAYTKNNILIQSAQAMLAQANQVPQGVLQLLQ